MQLFKPRVINTEARDLRRKIVKDINKVTSDWSKIDKELKKTIAYKVGRSTGRYAH